MANGARIVKLPSAGNSAYIADGDAPTTVSHVEVLNRYLIANDVDTEQFYWSDINEPEVWTAQFASAEGIPDYLMAILRNRYYIYLMGKRSLEVWRDDGSTPFVPELQGYVQSGTIAKYSFTNCDGILYWLDHESKVVRLEGITPQVISNTLAKYIQGFTTVTDAIGDYAFIGSRKFYILSFPAEGKTLVYDINSGLWSRWGFFQSGDYLRHKLNSIAYSPKWNFTLMGDNATDKIYKISHELYTDVGNDLRTLIRTGHINHDTEAKWKFSRALTFRLKKTSVGDAADIASMTVRWRDNGSTSWKTERTVELGAVGNTEFIGRLPALGRYRSRQYEIALSADHPLVLVSMEEDFDYGL